MSQKNMVPILLLYSCVVPSMKNIRHAYSVEKYGYVIGVHLIAISCKIDRDKNMYKTYM
jgi:tetrahydromethanopterin S-methyltransferase subunit D